MPRDRFPLPAGDRAAEGASWRNAAGILFVATALGLALALTWGTTFSSGVVHYAHALLVPLLVPVLLLATAGGVVWSGLNLSADHRRGGIGRLSVGLLLSVASLAAVGWYAFTYQYAVERSAYWPDITVSAGEAPDFAPRPPYQQAVAQLPRNQGRCVGSLDPEQVTYVAGDGRPARWTGFADGNTFFRGAACVVVWDGKGQGADSFRTCAFPEQARALQGSLWNSLGRTLHKHTPRGTLFRYEDAYGDCDADGHAVLFVPLIHRAGWIRPHDVAGGIAVVRSSDDVVWRRSVKVGELPGPVYPQSLAIKGEMANRAQAGLAQWRSGRGGYVTAGDVDGVPDRDDPNIGNTGQFVLQEKGGGLRYVTPLTPIGTGGQIVAMALTEADHVTSGEVNPTRLLELSQPRVANATTAQTLQTAYANTLPWANAKLHVLEIVPGEDQVWRASIGRPLDVLYKVFISADGSSEVRNAVTGQVIARASADGQPVAAHGSEIGAGGVTVPPGGRDLLGTTTEELIRLRDQVQAELDRRARAAP